jgi:multimeric flavodoxin WrbA
MTDPIRTDPGASSPTRGRCCERHGANSAVVVLIVPPFVLDAVPRMTRGPQSVTRAGQELGKNVDRALHVDLSLDAMRPRDRATPPIGALFDEVVAGTRYVPGRRPTAARRGTEVAAHSSSTSDTHRERAHITMLNAQQGEGSAPDGWDFSDLRALFINCTLKRSPEVSNTQGLADLAIEIMRRQGVEVESLRAIDHDIATGVWPDMTEHGWERDEWPAIAEKVMASDILMIGTPIWLGEKSSVCTRVIERLYGNSHLLNDRGQYAYYGRVGGCLVTGNEDGVKHCAMNVLYSLQHLGYVIPPQGDAGWIGEAGPGPSYLDPGSGGPENDFTNRNTTFMTWNLLHLARLIKDAGGIPAHGNQRSAWDAGCRFDFPNPDYR